MTLTLSEYLRLHIRDMSRVARGYFAILDNPHNVLEYLDNSYIQAMAARAGIELESWAYRYELELWQSKQ